MSVAPLFTTPPPSSTGPVTGLGSTFPPKSINTIGDALAAASGLSQNGTLTNALQPHPAGLGLTATNPNSSLAATLNPGVNLKASAQLQVTDFVNTTPNAFPPLTHVTPPSAPADTQATGASATNTSTAPTTGSSNGTDGFSIAAPAPSANTGASTGIYSAVANSGTSTIRGSSLNVVA